MMVIKVFIFMRSTYMNGNGLGVCTVAVVKPHNALSFHLNLANPKEVSKRACLCDGLEGWQQADAVNSYSVYSVLVVVSITSRLWKIYSLFRYFHFNHPNYFINLSS